MDRRRFMKKHFQFICLSLIFIKLFSTLTVWALSPLETNGSKPNFQEGFLIMDTWENSFLPDSYRNLPALNISGSAQFKPSQLENLKKSINVLDTYIIDLRQESHGFLNDDAVSFYSPIKLLNNGFDSEETLTREKADFISIKPGIVENIFTEFGSFLKVITVEKSQIEINVVKNASLNYVLFSTRDGFIPAPEMVDSFVAFVVKTPPTTHLHFHCDNGEGRTTMYLAMFQMMKESSKKTLNKILAEQLQAGGIVLTTERIRAEFLECFYAYTVENAPTNFKTPFSKWIQSNY